MFIRPRLFTRHASVRQDLLCGSCRYADLGFGFHYTHQGLPQVRSLSSRQPTFAIEWHIRRIYTRYKKGKQIHGFLKLSTRQNWGDGLPGVNIKSQQALCLRLFFTVAGWWIFDQWARFVVLCAKSIIQVILMKTDPSHLNGTRCSHIIDHDYAPFQPNFQTIGLSNLHHSWLCVCDLTHISLFHPSYFFGKNGYLWKPSQHTLVERAVSYLRARNLVDQCPQCLLLATAISLQS